MALALLRGGSDRGRAASVFSGPYAAQIALLAAIYFGAAKFGLSLAVMQKNVSLVWPPTGIALAALLCFGYRLWPGVALGALLINASTGVSLVTAAGIATGNTLEALAAASLLGRVAGFTTSLDRLQDVLGLVALAAIPSTAISATIGVMSLCLGGEASWAVYPSLWWQWWLGDAMGALVVAPVLLTWSTPPRPRWHLRRAAEAGTLLAALIVTGQIIFGGWFTAASTHYPLTYAVFPFVIWAALRFGSRGAATATLVVSAAAVWGTERELGPFLGQTLTESLMLLQTFMSVVAVTALVLAAAITQHRRAEAAQARSEKRYRELFENAVEMVSTQDLAGNLTSLNKAGERLTGYTGQEALKMNVVELVTPAYAAAARQLIARQGADDTPIVAELEILAKDGRMIPVEVSAKPILEDGKAVGMQAIARDVTERKQSAAALEDANRKLTRLVSDLEGRTHQLGLLSEMGDLLQSCLIVDEAYAIVTQFARSLFPDASGLLGVLDVAKDVVEVVAVWGASEPDARVFAPEKCWALRRGRMHLVEDLQSGPLCGHLALPLAAGYLCLPMVAQGEPLGILHLQGGRFESGHPEAPPARLREAQQRLAVAVAEQIALALANLKLQGTLRSQAIRDPLTGLFNRRYMEESLEREVRRAARSGASLGIMMIDIDHFKPLNDTHGREAGDALLRTLGNFLRAHVRAEDIACRYGDEEFVLILPETSLEVTWERAEQLREGVASLEATHRGRPLPPVTFSVGVASFPKHASTGQGLVLAADGALYRAKHLGRNHVVVAQ